MNMRVFEGTDLPDDFFAQVKRYLKIEHRDGVDATADAVFARAGPTSYPSRKNDDC
jgi:hypothetical protein